MNFDLLKVTEMIILICNTVAMAKGISADDVFSLSLVRETQLGAAKNCLSERVREPDRIERDDRVREKRREKRIRVSCNNWTHLSSSLPVILSLPLSLAPALSRSRSLSSSNKTYKVAKILR